MNPFPPNPQLPAPGAPSTETRDELAQREAREHLAGLPAGALAQEPPPIEDRQVTHHEPLLTQGASGDAVERLVKLLAHVGYANNTVVKGENPHMILDQSVMADIERFWQAYPDAKEDDTLYQGREGDIELLRGKWVGPFTWQKLYELVANAVIA